MTPNCDLHILGGISLWWWHVVWMMKRYEVCWPQILRGSQDGALGVPVASKVQSFAPGLWKTFHKLSEIRDFFRLLGAPAPVDGKLLQHRLPLLQVSFLALNLQSFTLFRGEMEAFWNLAFLYDGTVNYFWSLISLYVDKLSTRLTFVLYDIL